MTIVRPGAPTTHSEASLPTPRKSGARRAGVYVRISRDVRDQAGVRRQEVECRDLADQLGWDVAEVYSDNDFEASSGKPRPAYDRMLEDMESGRVDAVIGWHSDRIFRRPVELEHLIDLADRHAVMFAAVKVGNLDLSNASGRLVARLLGATAKYETELKGERQSSQLRQRAMAGLPTGGGSRPFGYLKGGMELHPTEAPIVRELVHRAIAGESVIGMTEWLIDQGVSSVSGKQWHPTVVRRLIMNPRIAGLSSIKGEIVGPAQWSAIVDVDAHRKVLEVLTYQGPARKNTGRLALLPGIIWCGVCGYELVTFRQQRGCPPPGIRSYGCRTKYLAGRPGYRKSCGRIMVKAESIEDDVAEQVLADLARPQRAAMLAAAAGRGAEGYEPTASAAELADCETRLHGLGVDYADGLLTRTEFLAARDRLAERIAGLRESLGAPRLAVPYSDPGALAKWWETATLAKRQALVRQRVDRVEVGPHSGRRSEYDPGRVWIIWR